MTDSGQTAQYTLHAEEAFDKARRRQVLKSVISFAFGTSDSLMSLEQAKEILKPTGESYQGVKTIEVAKVVGSEERYTDFSRNFLPKKTVARRRWGSILTAQERQIELPAIQAYELGGYYFVRDGNHRVSVANQTGKAYIEAQITSLSTEIPLQNIKGVEDLRRAVLEYEQKRFLQSVERYSLPRGEEIRFTAVGRFDDIALHIACHRKEREEVIGEKLDYDDAVESWFQTIYRPIAQLIRDSRVLRYTPERTEADLYVWMVRHWHEVLTPPGKATRYDRKLRRRFSRGLR